MITTPLAGTQVLWAAIFAIPIFGENLNWKMAAGMFITIIGIMVFGSGEIRRCRIGTSVVAGHPLALGKLCAGHFRGFDRLCTT